VGTSYCICSSFRKIDAGAPAASVVAGGIFAALFATLTAMLIVFPVAAVRELLTRRFKQ
jgi:biopolymer transport protein ExbB/TolQ